MSDLSFSIHPLELANALFNAVEVSKDAGGRPGCPHVMIYYGPDDRGEAGMVIVYGIGRIVGGRTTLALESHAPDDWASVCISRERADQVQSMLRRQVKGGKAARVSVKISESGIESVDFDEDGNPEVGYFNLVISKEDDDSFVELIESDPEGEWSAHLGLIDKILGKTKGPYEGPVALSLEAMDRVTALKGLSSKIMDLARTDHEKVAAVAVGPTFRGIVATIDRSIYADEDHDGFLLSSPAASS